MQAGSCDRYLAAAQAHSRAHRRCRANMDSNSNTNVGNSPLLPPRLLFEHKRVDGQHGSQAARGRNAVQIHQVSAAVQMRQCRG